MLKQNGTFPTIQTARALAVRLGMKVASQQVRQYDMTPPPIFVAGGDRWLSFVPQAFRHQVPIHHWHQVVPQVFKRAVPSIRWRHAAAQVLKRWFSTVHATAMMAATPPVFPTALALAPNRLLRRHPIRFPRLDFSAPVRIFYPSCALG